VLRHNHRFSGALARLAEAVRRGDSGETLAALSAGDPTVRWFRGDGGAGAAPAEVEAELARWAGGVVAAARSGDAELATALLAERRVLCAHRDGSGGLHGWNRLIETLAASSHPEIRAEGDWYAGRPVLVGANDYTLRLFNGDTGVAVASPVPGRPLAVAFPGPGGATRLVSPHRLASVETVFATTVHKSQGSEFDEVTVVLPAVPSRLLTRELLYTAVTRARRRLVLIGGEDAVVAAVARRATRASGLAGRLWAPSGAGESPGR
jgi:exodeoxyribonuclease V alpha subunit